VPIPQKVSGSPKRKRPTTRLREWRNENGFSLEESADVAGVSPAMWSRVENGHRNFSPRLKIQIARRLGVRVRDLFDVEPIPDDEIAAEMATGRG